MGDILRCFEKIGIKKVSSCKKAPYRFWFIPQQIP
jgi:hypothetical protein